MRVQIENYKEQPKGSRKIAIFDVYLPDHRLRLRRLSLVEGSKGRFISSPSFPEGEDENKKWHNYFEFSLEKKEEFNSLLMRELEIFAPPPF